ncbi:hypothetical protein OW950_25605 [Klebsiella pneumoniae]
MTITLQAVNELIASLESAGELSIREQKFLKLAKAFKQLAAENVALKNVFGPGDAVLNFLTIALRHTTYDQIDLDDVSLAFKMSLPETPATDAYLAGIKADGVEEFVSNTVHKIFDESGAVSALAYLSLANSHVKQLREWADK